MPRLTLPRPLDELLELDEELEEELVRPELELEELDEEELLLPELEELELLLDELLLPELEELELEELELLDELEELDELLEELEELLEDELDDELEELLSSPGIGSPPQDVSTTANAAAAKILYMVTAFLGRFLSWAEFYYLSVCANQRRLKLKFYL